jgi:hypothetical protein
VRCHLLLLLGLIALVPATALGAKAPKGSWAQPHIEVVAAHGLMGGRPAMFRPDTPLTTPVLAASFPI